MDDNGVRDAVEALLTLHGSSQGDNGDHAVQIWSGIKFESELTNTDPAVLFTQSMFADMSKPAWTENVLILV